MKKMLKIFFSISLLSAPSEAKDWSDTSGWTVGEASDESCAIRMEYEGKGESRLTFVKNLRGEQLFIIDNKLWTSTPDEKYLITFEFDGDAVVPTQYATGWADGSYKGFGQSITDEIFHKFVKGKSLGVVLWRGHISGSVGSEQKTGDPALIDKLSLSWSGAAVAQLERCLSYLRTAANEAAQEKKSFEYLPDNPFQN
jgi:hypothetical protein